MIIGSDLQPPICIMNTRTERVNTRSERGTGQQTTGVGAAKRSTIHPDT